MARGRPAGALRPGLLFLASAIALVPSAAADVRIEAFAFDLAGSSGDDAIWVENLGEDMESLDGFTLADGEGEIAFPAGVWLTPGSTLTVAVNRSAYRESTSDEPEFAVDEPGANGQMAVTDARFLLAQDGDEIVLAKAGAVLDAVAWGDSTYSGDGWEGPPVDLGGQFFLRRVARVDSSLGVSSAARWDNPNRMPVGGLLLGPREFAVEEPGTAFTAPDHSREVVLRFIESAQDELSINTYEFRDSGVARALLVRMAAQPALKVQVLVDQAPVGQETEERLVADRILAELVDAGAEVHVVQHERFNFDHAKYMVADGRRCLILSENLVVSALPPDGATGNRGWGVWVEDADMAHALGRLFRDDFEPSPFGAAVLDTKIARLPPLPAEPLGTHKPRLATAASSSFNATLVVGPHDHLGPSDPILSLLASAKEEILVEQLHVPPTWRASSQNAWPNAYLEALVDAAERGVRVRILLDAHFKGGTTDDNQATAQRVSADRADLPIEVRLLETDDSHVLHVKGVVVDERRALVGSTNWNFNSVTQNRELSVVLDAPEFAALFAEAFELDWEAASGTEDATPSSGPGLVLAAIVITVSGVMLRLRHRRT